MIHLLSLRPPSWLLAFAAVLLFGACDSGQQRDFRTAALSAPEGFTQTDARGAVVAGRVDADDWRIAPAFATTAVVEPAFPNPANEALVTVRVRLFEPVRGGLRLEARRSDGRFYVLEDRPDATQALSYELLVPTGLFPGTGLHRVLVTDGAGAIISYGDVLIP